MLQLIIIVANVCGPEEWTDVTLCCYQLGLLSLHFLRLTNKLSPEGVQPCPSEAI